MSAVAEFLTLAERVRALRKAAGFKSQAALAIEAGVSPSVVALIEQGKHADPQLSTLRKLAKVLGVKTADLVGPDPEE